MRLQDRLTSILRLEVERAGSSWESLLDAVAVCDNLARVAVKVFRLGRAGFLLDRLDPQTRQLRQLRRRTLP